jgi:DNA-binding helix-hairpin-helix protein with protein kinase domain
MYRVVGAKSGRSYSLDPGLLVGQGNEGRVYAHGDTCVKIFNAPLADNHVATIAALIALSRKVPGFAWPTEIVRDPATGEAVGFAMPFVRGETLESLLDARATRNIPLLSKVRLALRVAQAVAAAHAIGAPAIVLGDVLKAGNLVIDGEEATFVDAGTVSLRRFRTRSGEVVSSVSSLRTPGYAPKEVLDQPLASPSEASDRFALAVVLFELLFGRSPHEVRSCHAAIGFEPDDAVKLSIYPRWIQHPEFEPPSYDPIDLSQDVDQIFRAAFLASAVRPSALDWCRAIEDWLDDLTPKPQPRRRRRLRLPRWLRRLDPFTVTVVTLVVLFYAARWAWARYTAPPAPRVIPPAPSRPVGPPLFREIFK